MQESVEDKLASKCENCRFFSSVDSRCRRHAPAFYRDGALVFSAWPESSPEDWCGEFMPNVILVPLEGK